MAVWWRDVIREATFQGYHTPVVQLGLRYGMALFIASEVMFFSAFFWAFFASSLFPVGGVWPPKAIHPFDPFELPVPQHADPAAVGNHGDLGASFADRGQPQGAAARLGADRTARDLLHLGPGLRIRHAPLPLRPAGGIYPSTFFMATGFHGFHVIIGTTFLAVCLWRAHARPFQAGPSFRLRGGRLVLALCRRRLAVPVCLHLLVGGGQRLRRH